MTDCHSAGGHVRGVLEDADAGVVHEHVEPAEPSTVPATARSTSSAFRASAETASARGPSSRLRAFEIARDPGR